MHDAKRGGGPRGRGEGGERRVSVTMAFRNSLDVPPKREVKKLVRNFRVTPSLI